MKKRLKKKLHTDKTFGGNSDVIFKALKSVKLKKALIKEGKISVGRIDLGAPYKKNKKMKI